MSEGQQNWAGNFTYSAEAYHCTIWLRCLIIGQLGKNF